MRSLKKAVLHIRPDGVTEARILPDGAGCGKSCAGCAGCASAMPGAGLVVPLPGVNGRSEGELADVWLQTPSQTLSSLVLLGLPLACALGGGVLANGLLGDSGLLPGGGIGILLGFGAVYFLSKTFLRVTATLADSPLA